MCRGKQQQSTRDFYTVSETASLLGISLKKVRRWIDEGKIGGAEKVDWIWRIPRSEMAQLVEKEAPGMVDPGKGTPYDYQVTRWDTKAELVSAARQLESYNIPYVRKHRGRRWAIFRSFERT